MNHSSEICKHEIDWSLYAIIDKEWLQGRQIQEVAQKIIQGGATVIQYRDKVSDTETFLDEATLLREVTGAYKIPYIVNDRLDIALAVDADGVHLGQDDLKFDIAKEAIDPFKVIGVSINHPLELEWSREADYYGVGAVYPTDTKETHGVPGLDLVREIRKHTDAPLVGIGGIKADNVEAVIEAGCDGVAVISAILGEDDIEKATQRLSWAVQKAKQKVNPC